MTKDWKRLAEQAHRRRSDLGLSQAAMAVPGVLSIDRIQKIEGAKRDSYRLATLIALEKALRWKEGSVERVLAGGDPEPLEPSVRIYNASATITPPPNEAHQGREDEDVDADMDRTYEEWKRDPRRRRILRDLFELGDQKTG